MASQQGGEPGGGATEKINYVVDAGLCKSFLEHFSYEAAPGRRKLKYMDMMLEIANRQRRVLEIDLDDLVGHFPDDKLLERVQRNALRYMGLFAEQADALMPEPTDPAVEHVETENLGEDAAEVYRAQRLSVMPPQPDNDGDADMLDADMNPDGDGPNNGGTAHQGLPAALMRRFEVVLMPPTKMQPLSLREVSAGQVGQLVKIQGIVTRVADVKPRVVVATFICDTCGSELYQHVGDGGEFMPVQECSTAQCQALHRRDRGRVKATVRGSKFEKFQELKLQETPEQVPVGHIPRSLTVHCRGSSTRMCTPGDNVQVVGIFLPLKLNDFHQMKNGLTASTYLACQKITRQKKSYTELSKTLTQDLDDEIDELEADPELYDKLAKSIAPEIFGHQDVKKALLLQLVGGVTRKMADGMSIRGDINVLLMGDPGVAKSQLLKHITTVAPRAVYTTGKGSSGVGLTACVTRDKSTGEVALEGGALVLADKGICCIDEFDKMEDADRTAIHEVMEQQTVSIAKAGITTTLNARTSVLAAANPLYGRYNKRKSPAENINLPAALLSRFDLLFLLLDKADRDADTALARHITHVHRHSTHPALSFTPIRPQLMRAYISKARALEPTIPEALSATIVNQYVEMRQEDQEDAQAHGKQSLLTARQLLSILRMSQALARLRLSTEVTAADVGEAVRLVKACKSALEDDADGEEGYRDSPITRAFMAAIAFANNNGGSFRFDEIAPVLVAKGIHADHFDAMVDQYEEYGVLAVDATRTTIRVVNHQ